MAEEQGLSAENRSTAATVWPLPFPRDGNIRVVVSVSLLNKLMNAARSEGPQPPVVGVGEGVRDAISRLQAGLDGAEFNSRLVYSGHRLAVEDIRLVLSLLGSRHER